MTDGRWDDGGVFRVVALGCFTALAVVGLLLGYDGVVLSSGLVGLGAAAGLSHVITKDR